MSGDVDLVDLEGAETPGDEWEQLDVSDTAADAIARDQDREVDEFRKRLDDADQLKLEQAVFDEATYAALYKLVQDGYIDAFGGPISTGKEANVFEALAGEDTVGVKVYRINASNFRQMRDYLEGDPRLEELGGDKKSVVLAWTRKEFANLRRAAAGGVRVPEPIAVERNVLVMEYIGVDGQRARRLAEVDVENPETAFEVLREYMTRLTRSGLVHGDLSEYNVVISEGELVVLDLGQAVTVHHPNARAFLERDCENVAAFFQRQGFQADPTDLFEAVTTPDPDAVEGPDPRHALLE